MTVTITYPLTGSERTYKDLTQAQANSIVSQISSMQDTAEVPVVIEVKE